jgi:hypothetical protein
MFKRYGLKRGSSYGLLAVPVKISRYVVILISCLHILIHTNRVFRRFLLRKIPGFTSGGHALVYLGYLATVISIAFVK